MHDLAFVGFLALLFAAGFRRPFLLVATYVYIDIVSPQRLTYYLLNVVPISLVAVLLAVGGWAMTDDKRGLTIAPRQVLIIALLGYCGATTLAADFPVEALDKWEWVWKSLAFAAFLPLTLRTRLRLETLLLFMILSASAIIVTGGIKTLVSGGGYGQLVLLIDNNTGLYESSIAATVAITIVPVIVWLMRYGTVFPPDRRVRLFGSALIFACLLMPVGTSARTGLLCIALLAVLMVRVVRHKVRYLALLGVAGLVAVPLLPGQFTDRMSTIKTYQADESASTRLAVWRWTWEYAKMHPFGGGFEAYRQNRLHYDRVSTTATASGTDTQAQKVVDQARAYHSSYFEMLGEQGYVGLALWLSIQIVGLVRMEVLRRRHREGAAAWAGALAGALGDAHLIYLLGAGFVGIALSPFIYMLVGAQIGLDTYLARVRREAAVPAARRGRSATVQTAVA